MAHIHDDLAWELDALVNELEGLERDAPVSSEMEDDASDDEIGRASSELQPDER